MQRNYTYYYALILCVVCEDKVVKKKDKYLFLSVWKKTADHGAVKIDICAIWSPYKMISYVMIFVHNDRLRTVQIDIQMCAYWYISLNICLLKIIGMIE